MMRIVGLVLISAVGWLSEAARAAAAAEKKAAPPDCRQNPAYARLDFWVGRWKVVDPKGVHQGDNWIEKALGGCALIEHWRDAGGHEGVSLFYYHRVEKRWKQVWVTDAGLVKEKAEELDFPGPGLRFQGKIPTPAGETILDRRR